MSNAATFRRHSYVERIALAALLTTLPSGDRAPFIHHAEAGVVIASAAGTRLAKAVR